MKRQRLNKWRKAGRFEFRRESGRYSDGSRDGREILFVRIKGVGCCFASTPYPESLGLAHSVAYNAGTYFAANPVSAAREFRRYLLGKGN